MTPDSSRRPRVPMQGRYRDLPCCEQSDDVQAVFPAVTTSIPAARIWACHQLTRYGQGQAAELVALLVTELTTNVLQHTCSARFTVRLSLTDRVEVAVHDNDPATTPRVIGDSEQEDSGRGLALIEAFSDAWGHHSTANGKWVWFRLDPDPWATE